MNLRKGLDLLLEKINTKKMLSKPEKKKNCKCVNNTQGLLERVL